MGLVRFLSHAFVRGCRKWKFVLGAFVVRIYLYILLRVHTLRNM